MVFKFGSISSSTLQMARPPTAASPEFISLQSAVAGRYSLDGELGRGGMGIVYLARDVSLDRHVAIKLLPPELSAQADVRQQFLSEARAHGPLRE